MKKFPLTPFLYAIFPILFLLGNNIDQVVISIAYRSLVISILIAGVMLIVLRGIFGRWCQAAVITSICLLLIYSYGHVYQWLSKIGGIGSVLGRHRFMLPVWLIFLVLGVVYSSKKVAQLDSVVKALNLIASVAMVLPLIQIIMFSVETRNQDLSDIKLQAPEGELYLFADQQAPDIYYFILDAYTRQDVLLESFGYDNSEFLASLEELGFYIAYCSQSNYAQTNLAMASTFNLDYLQNLFTGLDLSENEVSIPRLIQNSFVRNSLDNLGYTIVSFESGFYAIQWMDADYYFLPPRSNSQGEFFNTTGINDFEAMLLQTTVVWALVDFLDLPDQVNRLFSDLAAPTSIYRERTLYTLDQFSIDRVPSIPGPKFVYTHLILPHFPYVFGSDGEFINEEKDNLDTEAYRDQLIYTNKRILEIVEKIIHHAPRKSIVVLQGDHGLLLEPDYRVAILNAYYLPDGNDYWLYPSISPVNTFRGIFSQYFHTEYDMLEDESYFSLYNDPFDFEIVPPSNLGDCLPVNTAP
jgi:hypothetical protein